MDEGLFRKHIQAIQERTSAKEIIIAAIKEKTGVEVEEEEISLSRKKIRITTSSVKKTALFQKKAKELLEGLGYSVTL
jgi:hypothetical protein